jgi:arylamine N-acetyltransferase
MNQNNLFEKYLALLGLKKSEPDFDFLCKLVKAHLIKIPFENISKLLFKKQGMNYIPDLFTFLDGIEKYNFGGTCYTNNYYFNLLLKHLNFDVKLCGADMKNPDVHLINIVTIDKQEFIVDGGYAAPFLTPLPRELNTDFVINSGNEKYIVKPKDENGKTKVEQHSGDIVQHWYTAKPQPREIEEFRKVIENSYAEDATFMNAIRIVRFSENGSISLTNFMLTQTTGAHVHNIKISREDIPAIALEKFGMPESLMKEAVESVKKIKDIYD